MGVMMTAVMRSAVMSVLVGLMDRRLWGRPGRFPAPDDRIRIVAKRQSRLVPHVVLPHGRRAAPDHDKQYDSHPALLASV